MKPSLTDRLTSVVVLLFSAALAARLFAFISKYAGNVLYWDQWSFYAPLFRRDPWWALFAWQHGPHREGLGLLLTAWLADLTRWDARADALAVGVALCLALLAGLILLRRLIPRPSYFDLAVPLLFLTLFQYEAIVVVPNLAYGALPLLLLMLVGLAVTDRIRWRRAAVLAVLSFLMIYTGFGLFIAPLAVLLLAVELVQSVRARRGAWAPAVALLAVLAAVAAFSIDYRFQPSIPNFGVSRDLALQYPLFIARMLASFWGWHTLILGALIPTIAGLLLLVVMLILVLIHIGRLAGEDIYAKPLSLVIVLFIAFSLLFCAATAVGRMPLGLQQAQVSRYLTLMIPAFFACFLHFRSRGEAPFVRSALVFIVAASMAGSLPLGVVEAQAQRHHDVKTEWAACYLALENVEACNEIAGEPIAGHVSDIPEKLEFLKAHRLSLFADSGG